jgi:linoleoyl-CoA desaturase
LPIVIGIAWWKVLIGSYYALYSRTDFKRCVSIGHVVEETTNPSNELGQMDNTWAIHNCLHHNFCSNAIVNWYTGGLNHQIEHHIFPHISHVHYGKIAK